MTTNDPYSAERVRAWAAQQYPSGTPLDQDRRMVAAETEAYLSGRAGREASELSLAAKHAGPIDPPTAQEPTDAEKDAAMDALGCELRVLENGQSTCELHGGHATSDDVCEVVEVALSAARAARRDEEER